MVANAWYGGHLHPPGSGHSSEISGQFCTTQRHIQIRKNLNLSVFSTKMEASETTR
jgi:hypothetical protein